MKTLRSLFLLNALAVTMAFLVPGSSPGQEIDCRMVAQNVKSMIQKAPEHTLTVVEDALVAAPGCVCEIVGSAIDASNADGPLVQKIVYTAVKTTQQNAPVIAECAVAAAPHHADFVRAAFAEAFEDAPKTGKKPKQKKPVQVAEAPRPAPPVLVPVQTSQKPKPQMKPTTAPESRKTPVVSEPEEPIVAGAETRPRFPFWGSKSKTKSSPAPAAYEIITEYPAPGSQLAEVVVAETASGKQVVEYTPTYAYDPKGVIVEPPIDFVEEDEPFDPDAPYLYPPGITFFGGPPIDMTGLYLVPPVASAPPFFEEEEEEDRGKRVLSLSTSRSPPPPPSPRKPRRPKPPVISRPISPTGP